MTHPPPPPPIVLRRIRTRLREAVDRRGIALARLARRADVSVGTVRNAIDPESTRDIHVGTLWALCGVLDIAVEGLFARLPDEPDEPDELAADPGAPAGPADPG